MVACKRVTIYMVLYGPTKWGYILGSNKRTSYSSAPRQPEKDSPRRPSAADRHSNIHISAFSNIDI